jgi:hypothetical protein
MKQLTLKPTILLLTMITFLIVALAVKDVNSSNLFASFSLIIGGFTMRHLTQKK